LKDLIVAFIRVIGEAFTVKMRFHHPVQGLIVKAYSTPGSRVLLASCRNSERENFERSPSFFPPLAARLEERGRDGHGALLNATFRGAGDGIRAQGVKVK